MLVQRINLDYVRKLILSEGSDSLQDSDSDPEFVLKKTCQDQVESSIDTSSDNDVKINPKKRTPAKVVLNENEDNLCNPFMSESDSSASLTGISVIPSILTLMKMMYTDLMKDWPWTNQALQPTRKEHNQTYPMFRGHHL